MSVFDGHDDLYRPAKFGEDRTTRAGCRCENVVFCTGRIAAKRQHRGIVITDVIRCAGYAVITEKPRVGQLGRIFRAPSMKNCVGAKNERCQFSMGTTTSYNERRL